MKLEEFLNQPVPMKQALAMAGGVYAVQLVTCAMWFRDIDLAKQKLANREQAIAIQNEALKIILDEEEHPIHPELVAKVNKKLDFWRVVQEQNIVDGETQ